MNFDIKGKYKQTTNYLTSQSNRLTRITHSKEGLRWPVLAKGSAYLLASLQTCTTNICKQITI